MKTRTIRLLLPLLALVASTRQSAAFWPPTPGDCQWQLQQDVRAANTSWQTCKDSAPYWWYFWYFGWDPCDENRQQSIEQSDQQEYACEQFYYDYCAGHDCGSGQMVAPVLD